MKILIISQYFWPENFKVNDLAECLAEKGHFVNVLTGQPNYPQGKFYTGYSFFAPRNEVHKGVKIRRVPIIPRGKAGGIRLAANYFSFVISSCFYILFQHKKYDAVFVFATSPITVAFPSIVYQKFHRVNTLLWVLDLWPESVSAASSVRAEWILRLLSKMVKYIYSRMDKILISSKTFRASLEAKGVPSQKIYYAPNWAEELYEKGTIDKNKYQSLLPDGFKVMFTGNIGEAQDCEALLATAKHLTSMKSNVQLVMVGDGRKRTWFEEEVKKNCLSNVHFLGRFPIDEMPHIIAHTDVVLVSLKDEPIFALTAPTRIQTALVSAKPIAAMLNGEGAAIVNEAGAGLTCPAGDAIAFAQNLQTLSQYSAAQLNEMGMRGKQYYEANFQREKIIVEIENLLSAAFKKGTIEA
ncbi:glycosyltransferase WbuB [Bacteroidia bacterium]|nr:glycosyltransferase WbuB [Bacteroidia bacterium]